jgi:putative DNA methylase
MTNKKAAMRRKLIEVSIPLEVINKESAREKSIRHGHPSTLHLWWARRPLAACRAMLFAQLVDDPASCPDEFPTKQEQDNERSRLHGLIERLVPWEASSNETILNEARYEIARSVARARGEKLLPIAQLRPEQITNYLQEHAPPIYDPFSGGGSIPLEAQRLGLKAMGSDLNPVAVLIGKALIEFPPKFAGSKPVNPQVNELHQWKGAQGLAEDVRYYGRWMREEAEKKIGHLYPKAKLKNGKEATVVAWLWARTVASPDPRAKGAQVPLVSSFLLSAKAGSEVVVKPTVDRARMTWKFEIDENPSNADIEAARKGTKTARGANFVCLLTGAVIDDSYTRREFQAKRASEKLMAIVAEGSAGRAYLPPTTEQEALARSATPEWRPEEEMDQRSKDLISGRGYGFKYWYEIFTPRQIVALTTFSDLVIEAREKVLTDAEKRWSSRHSDDNRRLDDGGLGPVAYADAVATYLAFLVSRLADRSSTICSWDLRAGQGRKEGIRNVFSRQAIPMVWDFAEANPLSDIAASIDTAVMRVADVLARVPAIGSGAITNKDAATNNFADGIAFATDPPYYDNIGYADLSDFFYVWLRRSLRTVQADLFRRVLTPKTDELVAIPYRHGGKANAEAFFLQGMKKALAAIAKASADLPATIFYAFKQSELSEEGVTSAGWASFLQAVTDSGLAVDGTWPVRSELSNRMIASGTNALASSIVLVCRRRDAMAPTITRADFLRALRREMPTALSEIRAAGVGPTDIQQAAIGPGIGIFSRYASVLNTDGTPLLVKDALKLINQVREEITSHGDAEYDSETRFALDWFAAKGFDKGRSGDAIIMTNAVNVSLNGVNGAGFFEAKGGDARLLKREELPDDWDPTKDTRATVWEACQHLIKRLTAETGGIDAAAALYNKLGPLAEPAHALARRLYDICEQKQWASEGRVYNQLHQEWDVIERRAAEAAEPHNRRDLFSN